MNSTTRRTFLKQAGLTAGALAAAPLVGLTLSENALAQTVMTTNLSVAHWGPFVGHVMNGRLVQTLPFAKDPYPNSMVTVMPDLLYAPNRVKYPMIRQGFYKTGRGAIRRSGAPSRSCACRGTRRSTSSPAS